MKQLNQIIIFLFLFITTNIQAQTDYQFSKKDTICILKVQGQIVQNWKTIDEESTQKYRDIIAFKTKSMLKQKYPIVIDTNSFDISSKLYHALMQMIEYKKDTISDVILSNILLNIFKKNQQRFQLLVIQNASYDKDYSPLGNNSMFPNVNYIQIKSKYIRNEISFLLFDNVTQKFIYQSQISTGSDPRNKEQTERQVLKGLKSLYYKR
jgi:hypothetical protein